jgi:hypothetical protein
MITGRDGDRICYRQVVPDREMPGNAGVPGIVSTVNDSVILSPEEQYPR